MKRRFLYVVILGIIATLVQVCVTNEHCDKDGCKTLKCKQFRRQDYGPDSPTVLYGIASGRLGNQLLRYGVMYQMGKHLGAQSFINAELKKYLSAFFEEGGVELPVLEETFCNPEDIPWEPYRGHLRDIFTDKKYRKGKFIHLWPQPNGYKYVIYKNLS